MKFVFPTELSNNIPCLSFFSLEKVDCIIRNSHHKNSIVDASLLSFSSNIFLVQLKHVMENIYHFISIHLWDPTQKNFGEQFSRIEAMKFYNTHIDKGIRANFPKDDGELNSLTGNGIILCNKLFMLKHIIHSISQNMPFPQKDNDCSTSKVSEEEIMNERCIAQEQDQQPYIHFVESVLQLIVHITNIKSKWQDSEKESTLLDVLLLSSIDTIIVTFSTCLYCGLQDERSQCNIFLNTLQYMNESFALSLLKSLLQIVQEVQLNQEEISLASFSFKSVTHFFSKLKNLSSWRNPYLWMFQESENLSQIDLNYGEEQSKSISSATKTHSILLLLLMTLYCKNAKVIFNPFLISLRKLEDVTLQSSDEVFEAPQIDEFSISIKDIMVSLCKNFEREEYILLLYTILVENVRVVEYLYSPAMKLVILPTLHTLYAKAKLQVFEHSKMLLYILNMLTQSDEGLDILFRLQLNFKEVSWFKELKFSENIFLSSFLAQVLLYMISSAINSESIQVSYIEHSLYILRNITLSKRSLDTYTTQRLVALLIFLYKKLQRMKSCSLIPSEAEDQTTMALQKFIMLILEMIDNSFICNLQENMTFVYHLLQQYRTIEKLLPDFKGEPYTQRLIRILSFFHSSLETFSNSFESRNVFHSAEDVINVLQRIDISALEDDLMHFHRIPTNFCYQESNSELYLTSRIWCIIVESMNTIPWSIECINLPI